MRQPLAATPTDRTALFRRLRDRLRPGVGIRAGRPTVADWTVRRQVAFSRETLTGLKALAEEASGDGRAVTPMQVAAALLEEAVRASNADPTERTERA